MNLAALLAIAAATVAPAESTPAEPAPEVSAAPSEPAPDPIEPQRPKGVAAEEPTEPDTQPEPQPATDEVVAEPQPEPEPEPEPTPTVTQPEPEPPVAGPSETLIVAQGDDRPPYHDEAATAQLRERHGVSQEEPDRTDQARWRCLIADPTCGRTFEINALAAYAYRGRQGDVSGGGDDPRWNSGRAQYDFWMNVPVITDVRRRTKYTRMTMGPKAGVIFSDSGSTWGNLGMAFRYWFNHKRWSPTLEFTSALSFKLGERSTRNAALEDPKWKMTRGPVGFTADVGVGLGGFGAIVLGGQYDSPLAREDVPEQFRVSAGGAFFIGFRGNILWGGPAAAAVATHAITQRSVEAP